VTHSNNEQAYFARIRGHITELRRFLNENDSPETDDPVAWFDYIASVRVIQGNTSNDQSFLATMLAKNYLLGRFELASFDAAEKAQGAPGLDIDVQTTEGHRVIGEIKTTVPYGKNDLGANQRKTFRKDFAKLNDNMAAHKFFFVTNRRTFDIVNDRYVEEIPGVEIILLFDQ